METALSTISSFPSNRDDLKRYFVRIKHEILEDDRDPLLILKQLKYVEKIISEILSDPELERYWINEHAKYKEKTLNHLGCKFSEQETGVKYFYVECGDPVWDDLNQKMTDLKEKIKAREKFLQSADQGFIEPGTGVFVTPPPRMSKTKITVALME